MANRRDIKKSRVALKIALFIFVFVAGFLACMILSLLNLDKGKEMPLSTSENSEINYSISAPSNWVNKSQIYSYDKGIIIEIKGAGLSSYADTGSMNPVLNENSNGIIIKPESAEQIKVGDIVTFEKDDKLIVHRVVEKGEDEQGIYFITKGDGNYLDDGKIRFEQIKYVTIGIIY